jgi:hypothetical protein
MFQSTNNHIQKTNKAFERGDVPGERKRSPAETQKGPEDIAKVKSESVDDDPTPITPAPVEAALPVGKEMPVEADPMDFDAPGQRLQLDLGTAAKTEPIEISDDDESPAKRPKVKRMNKSSTVKIELIEIDDDEPPFKKAKVELGKKTTVKMPRWLARLLSQEAGKWSGTSIYKEICIIDDEIKHPAFVHSDNNYNQNGAN